MPQQLYYNANAKGLRWGKDKNAVHAQDFTTFFCATYCAIKDSVHTAVLEIVQQWFCVRAST